MPDAVQARSPSSEGAAQGVARYRTIEKEDEMSRLLEEHVGPADEERGAFIDWRREMKKRGLGLVEPLSIVAPFHGGQYGGQLTPLRVTYFADPEGRPPILHGKRTGHGRVVWTSRWRRLLERLRRPELWLRSVLLEGWMLDESNRVFPVLSERVARLIPRRLLAWMVRRGWMRIVLDGALLYRVAPGYGRSIAARFRVAATEDE